jgi:hypothetical protein
MSSAGQAVGGIVGGIVGFFTGGPTGALYGAQIGMMAGGYIDPPKGPTIQGPRLDDLTVQTSTYGAVIPRVYGAVALTGNVIWLEGNKIKETAKKKKSGGKGGGSKSSSRTYTYSATFAVALCHGPIAGVRRIWIGHKLFYDAGSSDTDTIIASNEAATTFELYLGTDDQLPDPRMQADVGVGNAPAYRGLAYLVFRWISWNWDGQRWYGIAQGGYLGYYYSGDVCYTADGVNFTTSTGLDGVPGTGWWIDLQYNGSLYFAITGFGLDSSFKCARSYDLDHWETATLPGGNQWWQQLIVNGSTFLMLSSNGFTATTTDGINFITGSGPTDIRQEGRGCHNGTVYCVTQQTGSAPRAIYTSATGLSVWTTAYPAEAFSDLYGCCAGPAGRLVAVGRRASDGKSCTTHSDDHGATWSAGLPITTVYSNFYNITWTADVGLYVVADFNTSGKWFTSPDLVTWTQHDLPAGGVCYDRPAWDGTRWALIRSNLNEASNIQLFRADVLLGTQSQTLGAIVAAECLKSGLLASGDIDVSTLTSVVRGYSVGSLGSIRSALEPLQVSWPFDVIQHGYTITFKPRGGSPVMTIAAADLNARSGGSEAGVQITTSREMDSQLPVRITLKHLDVDREYDVGEQYAERLNASAVNRIAHDLPIVMTSSEAAGKAEVLLYQAWLDRFEVSMALPATYNAIEPGDVVTLATPEGNVELRLTVVNTTSDGRLECQGRFANAAVYTPTAVGSAPVVTGQTTLSRVGPSNLLLLDIPMVHATQADPSILAAMYGSYSSWLGGVLVRTDDAGVTWTEVQAFAAPGSTVGTASNAIGVADSRVWDKASVLSVVMNNGELYSATELAVLNGANTFAYGAPGRWEIVAAQNCTLVSGSSYTLRDLLRGRFGTEWAMSTHVAGDWLVLLSATDVTAIGLSTSSIGLSRTYRAITLDQTIETGADVPFTYAGVNLECLSPVQFIGDRLPGSADWGFSWIRRSRTDGEWRDLVEVALGETSEAYELDVYASSAFAVVKRTIAASTPGCVYTAAQQADDFGAAQTTIYARVYQLSSVVGRGYPATGTFTVGNGSFFNSVMLQLTMAGANNSTVFTDIKGHAVTPYGNAKIVTSQGVWGSSASFDGSGDYLSLGSSPDFNLGGGAMTIEFWLYRGAPGSGYARVLQIGNNGNAASCQCNFLNNGAIWFFPATGSPASGYATSAGAYALDTWNHIAFVLESSTMMACYVNGVQKYRAAAAAFPNQNYPLKVGGDSGLDLNGNISNLRITKGVARYTASFTPPTEPFPSGSADPYWASVVLFMPLDTASGLVDTKGKSVTVNGNTVISTTSSPFKSSGYFDGTGDYLTVPTGSDLALGSGDFTIECWIRRTVDMSSGTFRIINEWNGSTGYIFAIVNNAIAFSCNNGTAYSVTGGLTTINTWHYVTARRLGGVLSVSIGTAAATASIAGSIPTPVGTTTIARASDGDAQYFTGYLGEIRVTPGIARDVSTIPTGPFPTF